MKGANVWVISCTQGAPGCALPAQGAEEAGQAIGWDVTVFDGKGSPDVFAQGIRAAIASDADAIITTVDCVAAKSAFEEARDADIEVFAVNAFDCNDPLVGGEALFSAELEISGKSYAEYVETELSKLVASYVIAKTGGTAKIIEFTQSDALIGQHLTQGFEDAIAECDGCEIVKTVPFTVPELVGGKLPAKASAALTQNRNADVVYAPYDAVLLLGVAQAVAASGRTDLLVTGAEGLPPNIDLIKSGRGQSVAFGSPAERIGWAAIDSVNRLLAGEDLPDQGIGNQIIDSEHNIPTDPTFYDGNVDAAGERKVDYESAYRSIWGVG